VIKVAMIGAGSVVFSKNLTGDILSYPEFKDATLSYMDIDKDRLNVGAALCQKAAKALGATPKIEATMDRRKALAGADFVINMVQIGGMDSTLVDFEIPRKYGLNFTIADTTGPGGLFRALRTYPMLKGLCADMMDICPNAMLLNYSNPMSMNMQTITRTSSIRAVGLCHSVQGTLDQLLGYIGEKSPEVEFICAGINHMAFYTTLKKAGIDLYPRIFAAMANPTVYNTNAVRFEMMKVLGYFVTESSEHNAEYSPYFIPRGKAVIQKYGVPLDEYLQRCDGIIDEFARMKELCTGDAPIKVERSHEYGSSIIHSMATGQPRVVYGNMPNNGAVSNLPASAIVEVPTLVDRAGCQLTRVGELPPQLVAYMMPHVQQHELFIRAAMLGRRDHVYQAAMFDPLTAATLTLDKIVEMCDELIAAHGNLLPKFDAKTIVPTSGKKFGVADVKALHASWDTAQKKLSEDYIKEWSVVGPFAGKTEAKDLLEMKTPVEQGLAASADGAMDLRATYQADGKTVQWQKASTDKRGHISLAAKLGAMNWCVAYGYAEIESARAQEAVLSCGSDDGIKIWLNGKVVHTHEVGRGYAPNSDVLTVVLKEGTNRVLVKIDNYTAGWGFGMAISAGKLNE